MKRKTKNFLLILSCLVLGITSLAVISKWSDVGPGLGPITSIGSSEIISSEDVSYNESIDTSSELSNDSVVSSEDIISSIESSEEIVTKTGWHYITSLDEINDGDYITFVSSYDTNSGIMLGEYNSDVKRFDPVNYSYSLTDDHGILSTDNVEGNFFQINKFNDGYTFNKSGNYLTSAYSSGNTCKLTNVIDDYSTFDIHFEDGRLIAIARGDKKCNTIKYSSSYFSLYTFDSSNFAYLMKYYGEVPEFVVKPNLENYSDYIDLSEWNIVQPEDLSLYDGMEFIPVLDTSGDINLISPYKEESFGITFVISEYKNYYCSEDEKITILTIREADVEGYFFITSEFGNLMCSDMTGYIKIVDGNMTMFYKDGDTFENRGKLIFGVGPGDSGFSYLKNTNFTETYDVSFYLVKK